MPVRDEARQRGPRRPADGREPRGRRSLLSLPLPFLLVVLAACEVEWGGLRLALEDPVPRGESGAATVPEAPALPEGPLLYVARLEPTGAARVAPAARMPPGGPPVSLGLPDTLTEEYRARFDAAFLRPGSELFLQRQGRRIGTLVLGEVTAVPSSCPSVARATTLLLPGEAVPAIGTALPPEISPRNPARAEPAEPTRRMALAAPVLAERLLADERAYLARRASLRAVLLPGDTVPGMAATYLVNDSLAPGAPAGEALSLFFLARYDRLRGFLPVWSERRRYASGAEKEALEYLDWIRVPGGQLHLLRLVDGTGSRLAAGFARESEAEPSLAWKEEGRCPVLDLLSGSARTEAPVRSGRSGG